MNILFVTDGSDRAYDATKVLAKFMDPREVDQLTILLLTWPARRGPLWEKAYDLWITNDDLHEAMEMAVRRELVKLKGTFESHAASTEIASVTGNPVDSILDGAKAISADAILLAVARDDVARDMQQASSAIAERSQIPVLVTYC